MNIYIGSIITILCASLAILSGIITTRHFRKGEKAGFAWFLITLGLTFFLVGEILYSYQEVILKADMDSLFPTYADIFYIIAYIPIISGIIHFLRLYAKSGFPLGNWKRTALILSLFFITIVVGVSIFIYAPMLMDDSTSPLAKFIYIYYPIADLVLVLPCLLIIHLLGVMGHGSYSLPWRLIAAGFILMAFGDILFSIMSWNSNYQTGSLIDWTWNLSYLILAAAGICQSALMRKSTKKGGS